MQEAASMKSVISTPLMDEMVAQYLQTKDKGLEQKFREILTVSYPIFVRHT